MPQQTVPTNDPGFFRVRLSHPIHNKRTVFRSVDEGRARQFVQNRFPRGEEAYIESPSGVTESYQHERQDEYGRDVDKWQPFDPETYNPVEASIPPGQNEWSDKEG